jgi:hypothetical protein
MAGGGGSGGAGFLERLSNDLKKRHGKMRVRGRRSWKGVVGLGD